MKTICIVGISGKLGQYMAQQALDAGYKVHGVCRAQSVEKLAHFTDQISIFPGKTNDANVIRQAVAGCDAVLCVLAPWGVQDYASGTARAVLQHAKPNARLIFSCGWHISRDGQDVYSWKLRALLAMATPLARWFRFADIKDQVRACDLIFASGTDWTVVRGCDLEEGPMQGLPIWAEHVGDAKIAHNKMRRIDFARFMLHAVTNPNLIQKAPAISAPRPQLPPKNEI